MLNIISLPFSNITTKYYFPSSNYIKYSLLILTILTDAGVNAALCLVVRVMRGLYQVLDLLAGSPEDDPGAGLPHPGRVHPGYVDLVGCSTL